MFGTMWTGEIKICWVRLLVGEEAECNENCQHRDKCFRLLRQFKPEVCWVAWTVAKKIKLCLLSNCPLKELCDEVLLRAKADRQLFTLHPLYPTDSGVYRGKL